LLTFHAFEAEGVWLLARQVEGAATGARPSIPSKNTGSTKEQNLQVLREYARSRGVLDLLEEVSSFISSDFPGYRYPGKSAYTFSLSERASSGNLSLRRYVIVGVNEKESGAITLGFDKRACQAAPGAMQTFLEKFPGVLRELETQTDLTVTRANWATVSESLRPLVRAIVDGWKAKSTEADAQAQPSALGCE
jgi:hypothetical protein